MVFEDDNAVIEYVIEETKKKERSFQYDDNQLRDLVEGCWNLLPEQARNYFRLEDSEDKINKLNRFIGSVNRLQNSFSNKDSAKALSNFENLDSSNFSVQESVFNDDAMIESLKNQKSLDKLPFLPRGIATQLSTMNKEKLSAENIDKFYLAMSNIFVGIVTDKNSFSHARSIDKSKVSNEGRVDPELTVAIGSFVQENLADLPNDEKELKRLGAVLKKELNGKNDTKTILKQFNKKFQESNSRVSALSIDVKQEEVLNVIEAPVVSKSPSKGRGL